MSHIFSFIVNLLSLCGVCSWEILLVGMLRIMFFWLERLFVFVRGLNKVVTYFDYGYLLRFCGSFGKGETRTVIRGRKGFLASLFVDSQLILLWIRLH